MSSLQLLMPNSPGPLLPFNPHWFFLIGSQGLLCGTLASRPACILQAVCADHLIEGVGGLVEGCCGNQESSREGCKLTVGCGTSWAEWRILLVLHWRGNSRETLVKSGGGINMVFWGCSSLCGPAKDLQSTLTAPEILIESAASFKTMLPFSILLNKGRLALGFLQFSSLSL